MQETSCCRSFRNLGIKGFILLPADLNRSYFDQVIVDRVLSLLGIVGVANGVKKLKDAKKKTK